MNEVLIAFIAALPPTIAALAAFRKASATNRQVTPSNGTKLSTLVERNSHTIDLVNDKLDMHIQDPVKHGAVCSTCLTIEPK